MDRSGRLLRECYKPGDSQTSGGYRPTLGGAFARLMVRLFAEQGLIVMDAAGREFHELGKRTLRYAIEHAAELEDGLAGRGPKQLEEGG